MSDGGKGDNRRKGSSDKIYRENYPKLKNEYIPPWKKKLFEKHHKQKAPNHLDKESV